jgi:hypothetical protein
VRSKTETQLWLAGENALPCITSAGVHVAALDRIVENTRSSSTIPRRASDVAVRSLAQHALCSYQPSDSTSREMSIPQPQGARPMPASISFSPPMLHFLMQGGLQHSHDVALRKVPSQGEFARPGGGPGFNTSPLRPTAGQGLQPSPPRNRRLPGLSPGIPEGCSTDGANRAEHNRDTADVQQVKNYNCLVQERRQDGLPAMRMFTFLRLTSDFVLPASKGAWMYFMSAMKTQQPGALGDLEGQRPN